MMFEVCRARALDKTNLFLLAFLLTCSGLALVNLGEAITKKRLIKETTSLLSLTLEPGNKSLVRSIVQRKQELKTKDGRDLITTSTLMTAVTNSRSFRSIEVILAGKLNMPKNVLSFKKIPILFLINSFTWLFFG